MSRNDQSLSSYTNNRHFPSNKLEIIIFRKELLIAYRDVVISYY